MSLPGIPWLMFVKCRCRGRERSQRPCLTTWLTRCLSRLVLFLPCQSSVACDHARATPRLCRLIKTFVGQTLSAGVVTRLERQLLVILRSRVRNAKQMVNNKGTLWRSVASFYFFFLHHLPPLSEFLIWNIFIFHWINTIFLKDIGVKEFEMFLSKQEKLWRI